MTEEYCTCGFPIQEKDKFCMKCLPAQYRMTIGRDKPYHLLLDIDEEKDEDSLNALVIE